MRKMNPLLAAGLLALLLSGCGASPSGGNSDSAPDASIPIVMPSPSSSGGSVILDGNQGTAVTSPSASASPSPVASQPDPQKSLQQAAQDIMDILRTRDLDRLAKAIDPEQGLRFSPYAHIDSETSQRFDADKLPGFKDAGKLVWGAYDGSGEPIELTFRDYFEKFVYDQDFASAPKVSVNELVGKGNVAFNGLELYPDASYVEFHYPGFDKKNEGMDWESLIVVVRPAGDGWKLCAIAHAQWTV